MAIASHVYVALRTSCRYAASKSFVFGQAYIANAIAEDALYLWPCFCHPCPDNNDL